MSDIKKQQELIQAVNCLKVTLPRMTNLGIPTTPENYAVWYRYSMGTVLELNQAIDDILNSGEEFTLAINRDLYNRFVLDRPARIMEYVHDETKIVIQDLLQRIKHSRNSTEDYSDELTQCKDQLNHNPDIVKLEELVVHLLQKTDLVVRANVDMEGSLDEMNRKVESMKADMESLRAAATVDSLTNISNRRAFDEAIDLFFELYTSEEQTFSLLMIDVDHFKQFNDKHGHATGDKVLAYIANILKVGIKGDDIVARYGGEEFAIILPETRFDGAMAVAENLRVKVANNRLKTSKEKSLGNITISVGVAVVEPTDDPTSLIERADRALYQAKQQGRNCAVGDQHLA